MTRQLSLGLTGPDDAKHVLAEGAVLLRGFALAEEDAILAALHAVTEAAPYRYMLTPGGQRMSAGLTSAGALGWVSDHRGYRYDAYDPETRAPWPAMPEILLKLAADAALAAGFAGFVPDSCLMNRYAPGSRLTLHQDKNERDFTQPIVSVSLGLPCTFLFGGLLRSDRVRRVPLVHGDVAVWGGPSRLRYHGVLPIEEGEHPRVGPFRKNLTFRKAG